jgi:hypothetical protein
MRCDGAIGVAELARLTGLCRFSPIPGRLEGGAVAGLLRSVAEAPGTRGANAVMETRRSMPYPCPCARRRWRWRSP